MRILLSLALLVCIESSAMLVHVSRNVTHLMQQGVNNAMQVRCCSSKEIKGRVKALASKLSIEERDALYNICSKCYNALHTLPPTSYEQLCCESGIKYLDLECIGYPNVGVATALFEIWAMQSHVKNVFSLEKEAQKNKADLEFTQEELVGDIVARKKAIFLMGKEVLDDFSE